MKFNLMFAIAFSAFLAWQTSESHSQEKVPAIKPDAAQAKPVVGATATKPSVKPVVKVAIQSPEEKSNKLQVDDDKAATESPEKNKGPIEFKFERGLDGGVVAIELSNDRTVLASGGLNKDITLRSTKDFSVIAKSKAPQGMVLDLMFTSDGKYLVACGDARQVLVLYAKDLSVRFNYTVRFRPERITEAADDKFVVAGRSGQRATLGLRDSSTRYSSVHRSFVGGLCSNGSPTVVYSVGDQSDGPYVLATKDKTLKKIVRLPGRPSRATIGQSEREVLVATAERALRIDVVRQKAADVWELPDAKKVEDIIYWRERDLYVTSDKAGYLKFWQRNNPKPVASHKVSDYDVYQVAALDEDRLVICGRQGSPKSISIWNLSFDLERLPKPLLAASDLAADSSGKIEMPKVEITATGDVTDSETAKPAAQPVRPKRKLSPWVALNEKYEVKKINPTDLQLRADLICNKSELNAEISRLKKVGKPIPDKLKDFEPLEIYTAILSPGGKLYLSTNDGLASYDFGEAGAKLVRDEDLEVVRAAALSRDPVDGVLIGIQGDNRVLEIRESGKLVSRGHVDPSIKAEDTTQISVTQLVASGSDYFALSNNTIYRRMIDGHWEKETLDTQQRPISKFALLESRELVTTYPDSSDLLLHPHSGAMSHVQVSEDDWHASNSGNVLIDSSNSMKITKTIPGLDGKLFCVFARERVPTEASLDSNPFNDDHAVTAACCTFGGVNYDDLITSNDLDWGVEGLPVKDRTVVDFFPGPSGEPRDVWFLTPEGLGLYADKKTQFWKSQFELDRKGVELSRIESLGNESYMVFTTDGAHSEDVFLIRPKK